MRGIYITEPRNVTVKELDEPNYKACHAIIEVKSVGICGSDVSTFAGTNQNANYPMVMGHEIAGIVLEVDKNDSGIQNGDRVALEPYFYCGICYPCGLGNYNNCENMNVLGVRMDGGMCERISHPTSYLHKIPEDLSWENAAMIEPLSIAMHALNRTNVLPAEHVLILGAGPIGILCALACKAIGAVPILTDIVQERLERAQLAGIKNVINTSMDDASEIISGLTQGRMANVAIDCSGSESAINMSFELVANSGRIGLVGWAKGMIQMNQPRILRKELTVLGMRNSKNAFPKCIEMLKSGDVDMSSIISVRNSFEDLILGFQDLLDNPDKYIKILGVF